jgi:hypothetical protein
VCREARDEGLVHPVLDRMKNLVAEHAARALSGLKNPASMPISKPGPPK